MLFRRVWSFVKIFHRTHSIWKHEVATWLINDVCWLWYDRSYVCVDKTLRLCYFYVHQVIYSMQNLFHWIKYVCSLNCRIFHSHPYQYVYSIYRINNQNFDSSSKVYLFSECSADSKILINSLHLIFNVNQERMNLFKIAGKKKY